ncbi:DMT family transporter [Rhodobacteraceae bacterium SC52]|nr:DMT family transporter [Rhodobacteraceae bacterium SC52]
MENINGILFMVAAMGGFALEDMFIKLVSANLPTSQILLVLGIGGTAIFGLWAVLRGDSLFAPAMFTRTMMLRNLGEMIGTVCFVTAITLTPLASASAILQATPLAVTLGAAVFLGAPVGWRRWTAILVGFVGVLMVVRPGLEGFQPASLFAVGSVIALATRDLCTRVAPTGISSIVLSAYGFGMMPIAGLLLLPFGDGPQLPTLGQSGYLLGALVAGMLGYYALTSAVRMGDVAVVTPFRYSRLIFAIGIGIAAFGEMPDRWTLIGASIIISSGLYTLLREQRLRRSAARPLATSMPPR